MQRSSVLALCLVMVVGGGLTLAREALGASPKRGGTLTVLHGVDISNCDVQAAPGYGVMWIHQNIHHALLTRDKDLNPVPDLAKRWDVSREGSLSPHGSVIVVGSLLHTGGDRILGVPPVYSAGSHCACTESADAPFRRVFATAWTTLVRAGVGLYNWVF